MAAELGARWLAEPGVVLLPRWLAGVLGGRFLPDAAQHVGDSDVAGTDLLYVHAADAGDQVAAGYAANQIRNNHTGCREQVLEQEILRTLGGTPDSTSRRH